MYWLLALGVVGLVGLVLLADFMGAFDNIKSSKSAKKSINPYQDKIDTIQFAIRESAVLRSEEQKRNNELQVLYQFFLNQKYEPNFESVRQNNKTLLFESAGRMMNADNKAAFDTIYHAQIDAHIAFEVAKNPDKEAFTIRNLLIEEGKKIFFYPVRYYQQDLRNLSAQEHARIDIDLDEIKRRIAHSDDNLKQLDNIIGNFAQIEKSYLLGIGLEDGKQALEKIDIANQVNAYKIEQLGQDADFEKDVLSELKKLTSNTLPAEQSLNEFLAALNQQILLKK